MKTAAAISRQQLENAFHKDKSAVDHATLELVRLIVRRVVSNMRLAPDAPDVLDMRAHVDAELLRCVREDRLPKDDRVTYAPWIVTFARSRVIEELRRLRRLHRVIDHEQGESEHKPAPDTPETLIITRETLVLTRRHLATALKKLPEMYCNVLVDVYCDELPLDGVCTKYGLSRNRVSGLLHRAKNALRRLLQDQDKGVKRGER